MNRAFEGLTDAFRRNHGFNYGLLAVAVIFFVLMAITPAPRSLVKLVSEKSPTGYGLQPGTETITESVNKILQTDHTPEQIAYKAKIMIAVLFTAAFLWGTEAIPLGATDLLVGGLLYLFAILPFDNIAKAYMKDAVFFIAGVLTIAVGVSVTGLDRRIGVLLLGRIKSLRAFCFLFLPLMAVAAGFFSEHALMAILVPILLRIYLLVCERNHVKSDRALAILLVLGVCFALNQGGPGSPAAGGRNAIMVGYLKDYGRPIQFGEWMLLAMPYVVVVSLAIGAFMYFCLRRKVQVPDVNFAKLMREEFKGSGKMSRREATMAVILLTVVVLWITASKQFGLGGPCVFGVVLMLIFRIISWQNIQRRVRFDVIGLYAAACAMGVGLKVTGASLWLAHSVVNALPDSLRHGDMLLVTISGFTAAMTNFMSDGATVASVGPVALSMAEIAHLHLWQVGLACAFASSFANLTIVGTPNNAIAYVGAVNPRKGEKLLRLRDFLFYGAPITLLAWALLAVWCFLGYWKWMPWPAP